MPDDQVIIVEHDAAWAGRFEAERTILERLLAPWLDGGIHHVGSTSIPTVAAKPTVDIVAGVRNLIETKAAFGPLQRASYVYSPHRPGVAHHFAKPSPEAAQFGLHLTEPGSDLWRERLVFRDALRADPELAAEYEALKRQLAERHRNDLEAYTAGKRAFVTRVLASAGLRPGRR